jgi:hypothetical protein
LNLSNPLLIDIMKLSAVSGVAALGVASAIPASTLEERTSSIQGFDISNHQPTVDFSGTYSSGARFVIIKVKPHSRSISIRLDLFSLIASR